MNKKKNLETCLVISTGLMLLWLIYAVQELIYIAFVIGLIGLFFNKAAGWITRGWYKLADLLGLFVPKLLLSLVFFLILAPLALLHRLFNGNALQLRKSNKETAWVERQIDYTGKDTEKTGYGLLVNTSFNVRGEPIVCTPDDAYRCFMRTEMDYLVMGNYLFDKSRQPEWSKQEAWKEEFKLD